MKINFTKKEYRAMVEALSIADWVLDAYSTTERAEMLRFEELFQKVFGHAKDFGMENDITYDPKLQEYNPSLQFEEQVLRYVDEYNEETFWDQLIDRLVRRDLARQEGEENIRQMDFEAYFRKEDPIRGKYEDEFEQHGIDRLTIK